jgi:hypothetical protein
MVGRESWKLVNWLLTLWPETSVLGVIVKD